jgi:hypothetical protein
MLLLKDYSIRGQYHPFRFNSKGKGRFIVNKNIPVSLLTLGGNVMIEILAILLNLNKNMKLNSMVHY